MLAYFDCFSGISGDMTLGALIALGVQVDWLKDNLHSMPLDRFDLSVTDIARNGISAKSVSVHLVDESESRNYSQIKSLIEQSPFSDNVKVNSLEIFKKIARAESRIHNTPLSKVHFHELGGVDALVDIVGATLCLEYLDITDVISSHLPMGTGFTVCRHGKIPLPAPATVQILKGVPVYGKDIPFELVTPTGAAIIAVLSSSFGPVPKMQIIDTGYGAGRRDLEAQPNLLRVMKGTREKEYDKDEVIVVETSIDDMNPEIFGFLIDRLFEDGALDVLLIPVFMKKNRPGTMVKALCEKHNLKTIIGRILSETTSTGVRHYEVKRAKLERKRVTIKTSLGNVQAKVITHPDGTERIAPEYEACKKIALEKNIPVRIVYDTVMAELSPGTIP
ncbi:MAG: nickel pincer cofactor biosynthesis protein LarC [Deltaproteobacteria bacterium]|nr:nickel pincer cofactor biosynthesis protein LarC [Deltaproteobacteria bacterium]